MQYSIVITYLSIRKVLYNFGVVLTVSVLNRYYIFFNYISNAFRQNKHMLLVTRRKKRRKLTKRKQLTPMIRRSLLLEPPAKRNVQDASVGSKTSFKTNTCLNVRDARCKIFVTNQTRHLTTCKGPQPGKAKVKCPICPDMVHPNALIRHLVTRHPDEAERYRTRPADAKTRSQKIKNRKRFYDAHPEKVNHWPLVNHKRFLFFVYV